jgi:membrane protease YdiL (CAAX protease family)
MVYILRLCALFFLMGAVTLDLFFLFRFSKRDKNLELPGLVVLRKRRLFMPAVALTILTVLYFTLPGQLICRGSEVIPPLSDLVNGSLCYLLTALVLCAFSRLCFGIKSRSDEILCSQERRVVSFRTAVGKGLVYGVAAMPPTLLITLLTNELLVQSGFATENQAVIKWLTAPETPLFHRLAICFSAAVVAPLAEELLFRGILFPALLKGRSWFFAALLSGWLFSLIHFHPPSFPSILVLSFFFCVGYSVTGSLVTPILMHMVFNTSAVVFAILL